MTKYKTLRDIYLKGEIVSAGQLVELTDEEASVYAEDSLGSEESEVSATMTAFEAGEAAAANDPDAEAIRAENARIDAIRAELQAGTGTQTEVGEEQAPLADSPAVGQPSPEQIAQTLQETGLDQSSTSSNVTNTN